MDKEVKTLPLDIDQIPTKDLVIYLTLSLPFNKLQELVEGLQEHIQGQVVKDSIYANTAEDELEHDNKYLTKFLYPGATTKDPSWDEFNQQQDKLFKDF